MLEQGNKHGNLQLETKLNMLAYMDDQEEANTIANHAMGPRTAASHIRLSNKSSLTSGLCNRDMSRTICS